MFSEISKGRKILVAKAAFVSELPGVIFIMASKSGFSGECFVTDRTFDWVGRAFVALLMPMLSSYGVELFTANTARIHNRGVRLKSL